MKTKLGSSGEFAHLVSQLQTRPHDPALKQAVVSRLPEMKALAKVNPLALYHLAQIHPESSKQYRTMMRQSAEMGCTNAMLALSRVLVKSNNSLDLHRAAQYINKIAMSQDTYIKKHATELLDKQPELKILTQKLVKQANSLKNARFFAVEGAECGAPVSSCKINSQT